MLTDLISFLSFFFSRCFLCISSFMMIRPIRCFNLKLAFLFDNRTLANVGNKCSCLHDFINAISSEVFSNFLLRFLNDLTISDISFPCFFLMCLKMSLRDYNFTANNINQKASIIKQTSKMFYLFSFKI